MRRRFIDRAAELGRLKRFHQSSEGSLAVVYGRRRCGKSRLIHEALRPDATVYYLADERDPALQRSALATEIARSLPGFDAVVYPEWDSLFSRWWAEAPAGMALVLDEFPALVSRAKEVPSVLQRYVDTRRKRGVHLLLCGSSRPRGVRVFTPRELLRALR